MAGVYGWQPYQLHVLIVLKSGSFTLLEPSGPVQACNGIALPLYMCTIQITQQLRHVVIPFLANLDGGRRTNPQ
jgi:hypothetical protein